MSMIVFSTTYNRLSVRKWAYSAVFDCFGIEVAKRLLRRLRLAQIA